MSESVSKRLLWGGGLVLVLAVPAGAQGFSDTDRRRADHRKKKRVQDPTTIRITPMPNWSIRKEVDRLDTSMKEYSALIRSLSRASTDLGKEFKKYLKNPHDQVLASSVERKMALYAKTVMRDFDDIIADQDVLGTNFRELQRKLVHFSGHLGGQAKGFQLKLDGYRGKARQHERVLKALAIKIKEDPPADAGALRKLKRQFQRELRRYNLQGRYVRGYRARFKSYQKLQKNMKSLAGLFVNLHTKFNELIENLENERQFLHDSLRLQADTLRIKQIIRDGILGSEKAIGNVADKLANLYNKVDAFGKVHERINGDLNRFVESQGALMNVTRKIDAIGTKGGPLGGVGNDMNKAINLFYKNKDAPDDGELLLEKLKKQEETKKARSAAARAKGRARAKARATKAVPKRKRVARKATRKAARRAPRKAARKPVKKARRAPRKTAPTKRPPTFDDAPAAKQ